MADHLFLSRGPARARASNEITVFQLGAGADCIVWVVALFLSVVYIYPGY